MMNNTSSENISSDGDVPLKQAAQGSSPTKVNNLPVSKPKAPEFKTISDFSRQFLKKNFPNATVHDWNNWKWQVRNSYDNFELLSKVVDLTESERVAIRDHGWHLPLRITPYYASLMAHPESGELIRRAMVPTMAELEVGPGEEPDPLGEEHCSPVPNLVHRYPDRVLFLATNFCSAYCRYCTRSHMVAKETKHYNLQHWDMAIDYIENHKEVRDVLISGGDPFTISDGHIEYLLSKLNKIKHLDMIRLGTKVPVVLPQRITTSFIKILKQFKPIYLSLHFMHPSEITPETTEACNRLADAGIPLGSQTVLLKGINDDVETMKTLMHQMLRIRVRPYYIYQCDPIPGSAHFRTSVQKGLDLIEGLRGHTTGYAVPHFVIDAPHGGGKIPLIPDYVVGREGTDLLLRNYEGKIFKYPDTVE